jgi:hypothetical protein
MMALKVSSHQVSNQKHAISTGDTWPPQGLELRLDGHMNEEPYNRQFRWKKKIRKENYKQTNKKEEEDRRFPCSPIPDGLRPTIQFLRLAYHQ